MLAFTLQLRLRLRLSWVLRDSFHETCSSPYSVVFFLKKITVYSLFACRFFWRSNLEVSRKEIGDFLLENVCAYRRYYLNVVSICEPLLMWAHDDPTLIKWRSRLWFNSMLDHLVITRNPTPLSGVLLMSNPSVFLRERGDQSKLFLIMGAANTQ